MWTVIANLLIYNNFFGEKIVRHTKNYYELGKLYWFGYQHFLHLFPNKDPRALKEPHRVTVGTVNWGTVSGDTCSEGLIVFVVPEIQNSTALASIIRA